MYADDFVLISPSAAGVQKLFDIWRRFDIEHGQLTTFPYVTQSPLVTGASGDGGGMVSAAALTAVARGGKRGGGV